PHPAGVEEPLRLYKRGRGLRDDGRGDGRGRRPVGVLPEHARGRGAAWGGDRVPPGGDAADARGDREPRGAEPARSTPARRQRVRHRAGEHAVRGPLQKGRAGARGPGRVRERDGRGTRRGAGGGPRGRASDSLRAQGQAGRGGVGVLRGGRAYGGRALRLRGAAARGRASQARFRAYNRPGRRVRRFQSRLSERGVGRSVEEEGSFSVGGQDARGGRGGGVKL
ncbi:MAG: DNA repair protein RadA, partial [uncultured Rubrobacteraceae bacterium]